MSNVPIGKGIEARDWTVGPSSLTLTLISMSACVFTEDEGNGLDLSLSNRLLPGNSFPSRRHQRPRKLTWSTSEILLLGASRLSTMSASPFTSLLCFHLMLTTSVHGDNHCSGGWVGVHDGARVATANGRFKSASKRQATSSCAERGLDWFGHHDLTMVCRIKSDPTPAAYESTADLKCA